ncbi:DUF3995 domain-containing protein [Fredinandcohnia sp. QZ13]|uniref:DUF3995 domain-containing protein n=1 Tax=Fredinandcohnia sp. QZ13 TaxID=3073144 RepID=UPI002853027B|nr:DUF3995 domain-containing protein [Fredinandcohnia sp. QZ13]MDR4886819.1 DUF3995 domain-containing protein [Fredinandcohnia sp. QZ13]
MQESNTSKLSIPTRMGFFERFEDFTKSSVWPAYIGCLSALLYAVFVRFYHAAGGTIGMPGKINDPAVFYMGSYMAGITIMFCGFALIALIKPWSRIVPTKVPLIGDRKIQPLLLLTPTLLGSAFLIAHGVSGIMTKALLLAGFITVEFSGFVEVDVRDLALWDLLLYEPFFCFLGMMAGLTAAHYAQASGVRQSSFRRGTILFLIMVLLLTVFFVSSIVFDFVDKISF